MQQKFIFMTKEYIKIVAYQGAGKQKSARPKPRALFVLNNQPKMLKLSSGRTMLSSSLPPQV